VAIVHFTDADMVFSSDMLFTDNNCKNVIVIPDGFQSTISACEKVFDEVIPMIVYDATKN
jgi:glyoxylase-like metal-dependent hydrolase (beta-lactamase superfamily II)